MLDLVMGYAALAVALLVPLLLLAGLVWVLTHPLDLQEPTRTDRDTHRDRDRTEEPADGGSTRHGAGGSGRAA